MDYRRKILGIVAAVCLLFLAKPGHADAWLDFKVGAADSNPIIALQINSVENNRLHSLTYRAGSSLLERRYYREFSFAYGRRFANKFGATTFHAGIGLAEIDDRKTDPDLEPVIPLVASFMLGKHLGISGTATLNINRIEPFIGIELGIAFGQFR